MRVGIAVAVRILEHEIPALGARLADLADDAILDGDHRGALARVDVDRTAADVAVDDLRGVLTRVIALLGRSLGDVVRVARARMHGEVALGEAGQGAHEPGWHPA